PRGAPALHLDQPPRHGAAGAAGDRVRPPLRRLLRHLRQHARLLGHRQRPGAAGLRPPGRRRALRRRGAGGAGAGAGSLRLGGRGGGGGGGGGGGRGYQGGGPSGRAGGEVADLRALLRAYDLANRLAIDTVYAQFSPTLDDFYAEDLGLAFDPRADAAGDVGV